MPYTGSGVNPYALTIWNNGGSNSAAVSENIPVTPGLNYIFSVTASYSATWATGMQVELTFCTSSNTHISTVSNTSGSMTGGVSTTLSTASTAAPSNAAYAIAQIVLRGSPSASNILSVTQALVNDSTNTACNINYAFTWTYFPWTAGVGSPVLGWAATSIVPSDFDSLVIDGQIELMGGAGGVQCTLPELLDSSGIGPTFRILAPPSLNSAAYGYESSYDLSAPQPTQDVVASMLLDGERPFGTRASNRQMTLPVMIFGTLAGGMRQVLAAREYLMSVVDQQTYPITWTPADTGLSLILDCFRALPSAPSYGFNYSSGGSATGATVGRPNYPIAMLTLTIQALPYGRSDIDGIQNLSFSNALINGPVTPSGVTLDPFTSLGTGANWTLNTTTPVPVAGHSVQYNASAPVTRPYPPATYSATLAATTSITGLTSLSVWLGQAYDGQWAANTAFKTNTVLSYTLTDVNNVKLSFHVTAKNCRWAINAKSPYWTQVTAPIPQGSTTFSYNQVVSYSVTISNWQGSNTRGLARLHLWLSGLTAVPQTIANNTSPRGTVYNLFSLPGSARSPVNVTCQLPAAGNQTLEITSPSTGYWPVPYSVYSVYAETWGGGGGGSSLNLSRLIGGGGGGGAEYAAEPTLATTPGTLIPYAVGAAGLGAQLTSTVLQFTTPGLSHWTCPPNVTSVYMEVWGGGGAGAAGGGGGGGSAYSAGTIAVTPGTTYYVWVAAGGIANTGKSSAQNTARVGGNSWVGSGLSATYASSVIAASGGNTCLTGSSTGGHYGDNTGAPAATVKFNGGWGGASPGTGGGGGGGAGGASGHGLNGGDSAPYSAFGRWSGGGAGALGLGQAGGGGAGASAPGFPVKGSQPGGGGGGGYSATPLGLGAQTATAVLGNSQVNYLGADGGAGMAQFTYATGGGSPVNGGNTTFGSASLTGTVVTAHGGSSAAVNSAAGATGGTGSSNTVHANGGTGGLYTTGAQASYLLGPTVTTPFQTLGSGTSAVMPITSAASAASCSQGTAVAVVFSAAFASDLTVKDSAGNNYTLAGDQPGGGGANGVTAYVFTANITFGITTSTTLSIVSATNQQYGYLWYATQYLIGGVTAANQGNNFGTSSTVSGTFGAGDSTANQLELVVVVNDGSTTLGTPSFNAKLWYHAGTTTTVSAGGTALTAFCGVNQGGGAGDSFTVTTSGSCNWGVLCIPLMLANQQQLVAKLDWRSGTVPGASTTWATDATVSANGMVLVVGQSGTGVTSAPSAVTDGGGNAYTSCGTPIQMPGNGGTLWAFAAPVTAAMAQNVNGTVAWGHASAVPDYVFTAYYLPNVTALDSMTSVTGTSGSPAGAYTPGGANDLLLAVFADAQSASFGSVVQAQWNNIDLMIQAPLRYQAYGTQITDKTVTTLQGTTTATNWAIAFLGFTATVAGAGGGAAGGPGGAGYNGIWSQGAPGHAGGGKGGMGATTVNSAGGGAALPGGGGGGALSSSPSADAGGQGGSGMIRLTWAPPLQTFNTLITHRPGERASNNLSPVIPIPVTDTPSNIEYSVPSLVPGVNAEYNGTYTLLLAAYSWNAATYDSARTVAVTITQYEFPGGPSYGIQAAKTFVPSTDIVNGLVNLGEVTLPLKDYAAHNDQSYFVASIYDTDQGDRFMDILTLDTTGQTVIINIGPGSPGYGQYVNYYIDEASTDRDLGFVGATTQGRQHQVSVLDYAQISGGPLYISPGNNLLMLWSPSGAPNLGVQYSPRWMLDRIL